MAHNLQHLAIIMDGNRRYAKQQKILPWDGHKKGMEAVKIAITFCLKNNIKHLSLYTFSLENSNRSQEEIDFIFSLLINGIEENTQELIEQGIQLKFIGDQSKFSPNILKAAQKIENATKNNNKLLVNLLFCYGGRQEIIAAATKMAGDLNKGKLSTSSIDQEVFKKYLWLPAIPDPDLIIRTGGAQRLSNFLLFQAAYAELYFTNSFWPAITEKDLDKALNYFNKTKRNFGF